MAGGGQQHADGRAEARFGVDPDRAARLGDDAIGGGQAQAGALAVGFGGEERLEDAADDVPGYPGAGVADFDADVPAWLQVGPGCRVCVVHLHVGGLDSQVAAARHGVTRVDGEVDQDLPDLAGIGQHAAQVGGQVVGQLDVLTEGAAQQVQYLGDQVVEVQHARLDNVAAGEGEQLASEPGGPLGGDLDLHQIGADGLPLDLRGVFACFLTGERGVGGDDAEEVVEVVGHASGQLAEAFHPLGLVQLRFQPAAFGVGPEAFGLGLRFDPVGDVANGGGDERSLAGGDGGQGDVRREGGAVATAPGQLKPGAHRPGRGPGSAT